MDARRWTETRGFFDELVALEPAEQAERLAAIGADDPQLRHSLETLLAADAAATQRLGRLDSLFGLPATEQTRSDSSADTAPPIRDPLGLSGRSLSHFRVEEALGAGGMGVVYRAEDTRLGRPVALKFLLPQLGLDPVVKARFLHEARAVGRLDHANLCTIHEVAESAQGQLFLAMPLYAGETLKTRLGREGTLPLREALGIVRRLAEGLACAHTVGIVHRDLKPANVMLTPDGGVKILDFGLAKVRELKLTGSGHRLGTLPYMSPEQLGEAGEVDGRADLWALGVVLYHMLTGQLPFGREHELATLHAILQADPVPPSKLNEDVPPAVEEVVITLLQKEPARRYASAEVLLETLAALSDRERPPTRPRQPARRPGATLSNRARRWSRGWPRQPIGLLLAVAMTAGLVGFGLRFLRPDRQAAGEANLTAYDYVLRAREFLYRTNAQDNEAGLALLRRARELDPTYADAFAETSNALALRYWLVGDRTLLDSAVAAGRRAIELDPGSGQGYRVLGWALDFRGEPEAALEAHLHAVELDPNLSDGLANLYHWSFGRLDEAARWWRPALATDPTNVFLNWQIGRTYLFLGMLDRARALFEQTIAFEPSLPRGYYFLSLALLQEGRHDDARAQIERMLAGTRDDPSALALAGLAEVELGDLPAARGYFERGLSDAQAYERLHGTVGLAWIVQQDGEVDLAHELVQGVAREFEQFWGGQPKRPEDFVDLAKIRLLQGNREDALRQFERAVRHGWRFVHALPNAVILRSLEGEPLYDRLMAEVSADVDAMRARVLQQGW